ncbi:MAG: hypothetical protein ABFD79_17980, partial [Phycisphaerales bacterium]
MKNIKKFSLCYRFLILIVILNFIYSARADYPYFWSRASGDWSANTTWDMGFAPLPDGHPEHGNYDYALIMGGVTIDVTNDGQGSTDCIIGYASGINVVNVVSGKHLVIKHALDIGSGDSSSAVNGMLNLAQSATAFCERLQMGIGGAGCNGVINIADGATFIANSWGGDTIGVIGSGNVNMRGSGSMELRSGSGLTIGNDSRIDIENGQLKVKGDYRTQLQGYIDNGRITSFNKTIRRCIPKVNYQNGWTYVKTAGGCNCDKYPLGDLNHDCYVDLSDFTSLIENWLDCANPNDENCPRSKLNINDKVLRISHEGQSLNISLNCPKFIFNAASTSDAILPVSIDGNILSGNVVTVSYDRIVLNESTSVDVQLLLQWSAEEKIVRKWARYKFEQIQADLVLKEIVLGYFDKSLLLSEPIIWVPQSYPAFANGFFMGIEFPAASTRIEGQNLLLAHRPGIRPQANVWYESKKAIYGSATPGNERKEFENYITAHRLQPTGLHINYNTWWTSPYPAYTENDILTLMQQFKDNLTTPYGVSIDSFTIDDGWANKQTIWDIKTTTFPNGFTNIQNYAQSMGSALGLWSSPSCYYANSLDTTLAMKNGYETYLLDYTIPPMRLCCIAGPKYNNAY